MLTYNFIDVIIKITLMFIGWVSEVAIIRFELGESKYKFFIYANKFKNLKTFKSNC